MNVAYAEADPADGRPVLLLHGWRSKRRFDNATFDRSAAAFDNPDHVAIVAPTSRLGSAR